MILKIEQYDKATGKISVFKDGFIETTTKFITEKEAKAVQEGLEKVEAYSDPSCGSSRVKQVSLYNEKKERIGLVHLYVGVSAYLLNNEGKTIERIN